MARSRIMVNRDFGLSGSGFGLSGSDPFFIPALFLLSLITRTIVFFSRFIPALFFQLFLRWFSMLEKMLVNPVLIFFRCFKNVSCFGMQWYTVAADIILKMVLYTLLIKKFIFYLFLWDKFV